MKSLLIETSTERGFVAIMHNKERLFHKALPFGYQNSSYLLPTIEEALSKTGLSSAQLELIVTGIGPGSYTGIRVGAVAAKSISFACKLPLVGVCTLKGFIPTRDGIFAAVIDAKIGGAYLLKGKKQGEIVTYISEPFVSTLDKLWDHLHDVEMLVTPNSQRIRPLLQGLYPNNRWLWEDSESNIEHMFHCGLELLQAGSYSRESHLDLIYLRKTQAEIEKEFPK